MRGKPTVVSVWGSWCADCHKESPYVVAAAKELGSTANFVGIDSRDPGTAQAKAFQSRYGITWPSFYSPGGEALLAFPGVITPNSMPATVVLDAQGRPAAAINGAVPSALTLVEMVRQVAQRWLTGSSSRRPPGRWCWRSRSPSSPGSSPSSRRA